MLNKVKKATKFIVVAMTSIFVGFFSALLYLTYAEQFRYLYG
ncbi:hypothetical protein [Fangia hongkongensis]|nr:hypothetical protein [Fangia hongkongensis]